MTLVILKISCWLKKMIGHKVFPRECYLKGYYLQYSRSKTINTKTFSINNDVTCPHKIFETLVKISNDLTTNSDAYLKLLEKNKKLQRCNDFSMRYERSNNAQLNV